ncbi:MAG: dihydroorotase [Gilvibacter sp.]
MSKKVLLKSATIIDSSSPHHGKKRDILISDGIIASIKSNIAVHASYQIIEADDLHVSQGWFDSGVSFGEPGYEQRETLANGLNVAANSGFTHVAVNANTWPITDTKAAVEYIKSKANDHLVSAYPIGALTAGSKGQDLAELYDMHQVGAIGFYDYQKPLQDVNLLKIALLYAQPFDGLVQSFPLQPDLAGKGQMHEELVSTTLGLKGFSSMSEEIRIARDLFVLEYTQGKLHIPTITTAGSVALIRDAKQEGLDVSCSVTPHHLMLDHTELTSFDSNYKVLPPLRAKEDLQEIVNGLNDGTIDGITTDHNPLDIELKKQEFERADFGTLGLESAFGALNSQFGVDLTIKSLTGLKERFKIPIHSIEEEQTADLTWFEPNTSWQFEKAAVKSASFNSCFYQKPMKGKVLGVIANNKVHITE